MKIQRFTFLVLLGLAFLSPAFGEEKVVSLPDAIGIKKIVSLSVIYSARGLSSQDGRVASYVTNRKELGSFLELLSGFPSQGGMTKNWAVPVEQMPHWRLYVHVDNDKVVPLDIHHAAGYLQSPLDSTYVFSDTDPKNIKLMKLLKAMLKSVSPMVRNAAAADRIVLVEKQPEKPLRILTTLKGSEEMGGGHDRIDRLLATHKVDLGEQRWSILFLREIPGDGRLGLEPASRDQNQWLMAADPAVAARVQKAIALPEQWSEPVDGVSIGLRARSRQIAGPEDIVLEVALKSSKRTDVWNHRYHIYDYWPFTTFEVTAPGGRKFILAKPEGVIDEDDHPVRRTIEPGKPYIHAFHLSDWGVYDGDEQLHWKSDRAERIAAIAKAFAKPGKYTFRAIYESKHKRGDAGFIGRLVSPPVVVQFAVATTAKKRQRAFSLSPGIYTLETKSKKTGVEKLYEESGRWQLTLDGNNVMLVPLNDKLRASHFLQGTIQDGHIKLVLHHNIPDPINKGMLLRIGFDGKITAKDSASGTSKAYAGADNYLSGTWELRRTKEPATVKGVSLKLSVPQRQYPVGQDVIAELTLTNGSKQEWFFDKWLDDVDKFGHAGNVRFVVLNEQMKQAKYVHIEQVKRQIVPFTRRRIKPGESVKLKVTLNKWYGLSKPGTYTIHATYTSKGPFAMRERLPMWEGALRSSKIQVAVAAAVDLGKHSIRFEEQKADKVEPGLTTANNFPRTTLLSAKDVLQNRRSGKIPAGHAELVGRLPTMLPGYNEAGGSRLIVSGFTRSGASIVANVYYVRPQAEDQLKPSALYLRAKLPDDLPAGKYHVTIRFIDSIDNGTGLLTVLDSLPTIPAMTCEFEVPNADPAEAKPVDGDKETNAAKPLDSIADATAMTDDDAKVNSDRRSEMIEFELRDIRETLENQQFLTPLKVGFRAQKTQSVTAGGIRLELSIANTSESDLAIFNPLDFLTFSIVDGTGFPVMTRRSSDRTKHHDQRITRPYQVLSITDGSKERSLIDTLVKPVHVSIPANETRVFELLLNEKLVLKENRYQLESLGAGAYRLEAQLTLMPKDVVEKSSLRMLKSNKLEVAIGLVEKDERKIDGLSVTQHIDGLTKFAWIYSTDPLQPVESAGIATSRNHPHAHALANAPHSIVPKLIEALDDTRPTKEKFRVCDVVVSILHAHRYRIQGGGSRSSLPPSRLNDERWAATKRDLQQWWKNVAIRLTDAEHAILQNYHASPAMVERATRICLKHQLTKAEVLKNVSDTDRSEVKEDSITFFFAPSQWWGLMFDEDGKALFADITGKKITRAQEFYSEKHFISALTLAEMQSLAKTVPSLRKGMSPSEVSNALGIDLDSMNYHASGHNPRAYRYALWTRQRPSDRPKNTHNLLILFSYGEDFKKPSFERAELFRCKTEPSNKETKVGIPGPPSAPGSTKDPGASKMLPRVVVNSQKSLADTVGDGFQDEAWASPTGLLPTEFPDLTYVSGPADKSSSPKGAWRKPVVLKHEDSGVLVYVNCYRRRDNPAVKDAKASGTPFLPLTEPDYHYEKLKFHDLRAATATAEDRQVIVFRRGDILFKVESTGGEAGDRKKVTADAAETIWNARLFRNRRGPEGKPRESDWRPTDRSRDTFIAAVKAFDSKVLTVGEPDNWQWKDAELYIDGRGHYLLWVFYKSQNRGRIWRWAELDSEAKGIKFSGWGEG